LGWLEPLLAVLSVPDKIGLAERTQGASAGTSDTLPASVQDVRVNHRRFNVLVLGNSVIEYEIHQRLRNVS